MSVTESVMAAGSITVNLDRSTPVAVTDQAAGGFSQILVTPVALDVTAASWAELVSHAIFRGILRKPGDDHLALSGASLAILLGDEEGRANTWAGSFDVGARPLYNGSATSWIRNNILRATSGGANGISAGSIPSAGSPTKAGKIKAGQSPRQLLPQILRMFTTDRTNPLEFRVNHNATLDVDDRETLYPTTTDPVAVAVENAVYDPNWKVIPAKITDDPDWEAWAGTTRANGPTVTLFGDPYTYSGDAEIDDNPFVDINGNPLLWRDVVDAPNVSTDADAAKVAEHQQGKHSHISHHVKVTTSMYDFHTAAQVGDTIWLHDPRTGLTDITNPVRLGGELVFPLADRIIGATWPVRDGMGVYARTWDGSAFRRPLALHPYVLFEDDDTQLEVGSPRRALALAKAA